MKYYQDLINLKAFTIDDANRIIGNMNNTLSIIRKYISRNYIRKIKRNLYVVIDLASGGDVANKYEIASKINNDSYVSHHSAFEFYGYYNQVFNIVTVSSFSRFTNFDDQLLDYQCILNKCSLQIETILDVKVTSIERTIVDSIKDLGKYLDVEELIKCLEMVNLIDISKVIEMLEYYDRDILYRKVGYFLSWFKEELNIPLEFFSYCKNKGNIHNIGEICSNNLENLEFINEWGLYAYKNLLKLKEKGGIIDV